MNEKNNFNRRTILKSIGAGASLLSVTGVSTASAGPETQAEIDRSYEMRRATELFSDRENIQQALLDHGEPVREQLDKEGVDIDLSYDKFDDVRVFPDDDDGVPTAHIVAEVEDDARRIDLHVLPQADRTFAVEKTDSDVRRFDAELNSPQPAAFCETDTYCDGYCKPVATQEGCQEYEAGYEVTEECCTYSDGSTSCEITNKECTYDCPGKDC